MFLFDNDNYYNNNNNDNNNDNNTEVSYDNLHETQSPRQ